MRFDDSLATVLAGDTASAHGASAAWRQLVDLVGRRRIDPEAALPRLRELRERVPAAVRGASGRALALVEPPAGLVALFAEDALATAAPVLRTARLDGAEWLAMLPALSPAARAVLRHRRDLPPEVVRGLESFGATDFVLGHDNGAPGTRPATRKDAIASVPAAAVAVSSPAPAPASGAEHPSSAPRFEIADLVARIDAFRREKPAADISAPAQPSDVFQFLTDAAGVIRWVEGVVRTPLIGVALGRAGEQGRATIEDLAPSALLERRGFHGAILRLDGTSSAAGRWRLAGEPRFDPASGRFTGMAGIARRIATPAPASTAATMLRELVHELRTPANAIGGFAELIASELLGPVAPIYRDRATLIQRQGGALTDAIADLDTAARVEGAALELRPVALDLAAVVAQAVSDLQPMAQARHLRLTLAQPPSVLAHVDDRATRRLVERLLATVVVAALPGEHLGVQLVAKARSVRLHVTRPRQLPASDDALLTIDRGESDEALLLGAGFTLRLVRGLADALGGSLAVTPDRLTLRLPAAVTTEVEGAAAQ